MEWIECTLGDVLNFRRGYDLPHSEMRGGDVPVAGSNGVIGYHDVATSISPVITIGRSGNVGTPYMYEKAWAHNTTLFIDDFKGNDPLYLYYLIKTLPLSSFGGGSAVPTLNRNHIHPLVIKHCSDLNEQRRIAGILKSFDDKIALNSRINHNLEEQAQALYKSWFVDFEPFKGGEFVDSELGRIPEGWVCAPLTSILEYRKIAVNPQKFPNTLFTHYSLPAFDNSREPELQRGAEIMSNKFRLDNRMVLFSKLNPRIKRLWPIDVVAPDSICSTEFIAYKALKEQHHSFVWCYLNSDSFYEKVMAEVNGATGSHQRFHAEDTLNYIIPYNQIAISEFSEHAIPLLETIIKNERENRILKKERDELLPKLMAGDVSITR